MRGVIYILYGNEPERRFLSSYASLRAVDPDIPVTLITDRERSSLPVSQIVKKMPPEVKNGTLDLGSWLKTRWIWSSPYEETLYLDTDTKIVTSNLWAPMDLMIRHDYSFGICYAPFRDTVAFGEPYAQSCFNTGVVYWRTRPYSTELFRRWAQTELAKTDQFFFSKLAWDNPKEYLILPPIWNWRPFMGEPASDVQILHGPCYQ